MTECTCQTVSDDYSDHMHESASQPECPVYTAGKEARMAAMTDEERTLAEVRREIAKMPEDDQIRGDVSLGIPAHKGYVE